MGKEIGKIGVAIITYNREKYFKQVYDSLMKCDDIDDLVVVNDGMPYKNFHLTKGNLIQHDKNQGVALSKNDALEYLINKGCKHLFLIEDDILIKDCRVFKEYIRIATETGLYHLNFELADLNEKRFDLTYKDKISISCYRNPQGAFSYIMANIIRELGYLDEGYTNAFEHVEFAYRLVRNGLLPAFWYFPDISNSTDYLEPIKGSQKNSTITGQEGYQNNWNKSAQHFITQHGFFTNQIPDIGNQKAISALLRIQKNYGKQNEVEYNNKLVQSTQKT